MKCSTALHLLQLNRPGERSSVEEAELRAHVATCRECSAVSDRIGRLKDIEAGWRTAEVPVPDLRHVRARVLAATAQGRRSLSFLPGLSSFRGSRGFTRLAYGVASLAFVGWFIAGQATVRMAHSRLHEAASTPAARNGGPAVVYVVNPASVASILASGSVPFQGKLEVSQSEVDDLMRKTEHELQRASLQGPERRARLDKVVRTIRSSVTVTIRFRTPGV